MKTGTEFNLAQIIESLSANAAVSRVIPEASANAREFSRILDAAMDIASRGESGMPTSAISESGSIMPLYVDDAAPAGSEQAQVPAVITAEQPLQLATVNFLSGRTVLISPVDVAEPVASRASADPERRGLPQWWQDERSPHPAQSLSGVMALVHGSTASNQDRAEPHEWDGDFDIHSASEREQDNPDAVAGIKDSDLDDAITSLMAWQDLKQVTPALPREPDALALAPRAAAPTTASSISYLDARRNSQTTRSAEPPAAGFAAELPVATPVPVSAAPLAPVVVSALQPQLQPLAPERMAERPNEAPAREPIVAVAHERPLAQALLLDIPSAATPQPQPQPQPLRQVIAGAAEPADVAPLVGAIDDSALIEAAVPRDVPVTDAKDVVQQRSGQPLAVRAAEFSLSQDHSAGTGDPRGQNEAPRYSRSDAQTVAEPQRESGQPVTASVEAVVEAPALQVKTQVRFDSGETGDAGVATPIRDTSQPLQTLPETAAAARPQPARTELRQEFADNLLSFATEQLEIPEQGAVTRLRLEVSPPELGNLEIEVTQGPDALDVRIIASDEAAAATLRESEHVMRELLSRNDSSRITIGIDVSTRDSGHGRRRESGSEPDTAPGKSRSRLVKIRLNNENTFDIYV